MSSCLDDSAMDAQGDISDCSKNNVARTKQPAWNKPPNDVVVGVGPVMGADSWPALSESARASPKSSSDSLKALSDGSVSIPQGSAIVPPPKEQVASNANPSSSQNHAFSTRHKSGKRVELPHNNSGNPPGQPVVPDSSPRGPHQKSNNGEGGPRGRFTTQPRAVNNNHPHPHPHPHQSNWNRRNNYGGRRDQDRANYEWNSHHRSFKGRDVEMQQPRFPRNYVTPQPAPFISSPVAVRPFGNPMVPPVYRFPGMPVDMRGVMPFVNAPVYGYPPHVDPQLRSNVVKQIEYYFSSENLCKDIYLRRNMDDNGWVFVSLIAGFNRVKNLTSDVSFILDALRISTVVEIQGDKIRRKNDWQNWLLRPSNQFVPMSGTQSSVGLHEGQAANNNILSYNDPDLNNQLQTAGAEG